MPSPTDIELSVGLSTDDIKQSAKDLQNSIKDVFDKSSGKELDKNLENLKKQMSASAVKANQLMEQLRKLESTKIPTQEYKEISAQIAKAEAQLSKLRDMEERFVETGRKISPQKMKDMQYAAAELENTIEYAKGELQDLIDTGKAFTLGSDTEQYSKVADSLANVNNQSRLLLTRWNEQADAENQVNAQSSRLQSTMQALTMVMRKLGSSIKQTFKDMVNLFKSVIGHVKNFASSLASIPSHFKKASSSHMDFNKGLKRGLTTILKYGFGIRSLYFLFRKLRTAVADGIKSVVLWEGENGRLNKSISSLQSSLATLKNSVGAMVVPLINSLVPAITKIIDLITLAIQRISQFIAALTGQKTYLVATKVQSNYAASLDKTAGSANKAKKALDGYLGTFDELNNVNTPDASDSGGGGAGGTGFKEMPIDPKWFDLIDKLKKMWELGDFTELGRELGTKLRDFLESIPWDKIQDTANKLGKSLATLINGFVEVERLGYDIGKTIAESINTIFHFVNGFVHNLHWDSIGKFIADTFNGFFENIDWPLIKDTVVTGLAGIAEAIQTFINEFHWDNISDFIINGVDTIVSGIKAFFEGIDWLDLGSKIGDQITKSIQGINWRDVGQALGDILQAAIDFFSGLIDELNADDVVNALTEMLNGFFDRVDTQQLGQLIAKVINLAIDVAKGFWAENKDTLKQEGQNLLNGFFEEIDTEDLMDVVGDILTAVVLVGIARAIPGIIAGLVKLAIGQKIAGSIAKQIAEALAVGGAGAGASGAAGGASSGFLGSVTAAGTSAGLTCAMALVTAFVGYKIGNKLVGPWLHPEDKELYENFRWFEGEDSFFKTIFNEDPEILKSAWSEMWNDMTGDVAEAASTLKERAGEHFQNFKDKVSETFEKADDKVNAFGDTLNEKKESISTAVSGMKDTIASKMDEVGVKFNTTGAGVGVDMTNMSTAISEKVGDIKSKFGEWASDLSAKKTDISNKLGELKDKASESFTNMKEKVSEFATKWGEKFTDAKTKLTEFSSDAKTKFQEIQESVVKCFDGIKDKIKAPINAALGFVEKLVNGIIEAFNGLGDKLGGLEFDLPEWLPGDLGGKHFELKVPKLNTISIPRLAQGAVIPPNKEFLAMLGDQSHGTNIEAPLDTLVEAFNAANRGGNEQEIALLQEQNELLRQLLQKEFGISEKQIFQSVRNQNKVWKKSTGSSAFA